ncbi:MAG: hypothetical protein IPK10_09785 [Bacteroidetes bacterium]|nr:hypothetical protein [Bacteroidota bacterium]
MPSNNVTSLYAIDSITLLAGLDGHGVYKTINKGAMWDSSNTNMLHLDVNGFVKAGNRILQISDGGLWASVLQEHLIIFQHKFNLPLNAIVKSITNDGSNWYIATDQGVFTSPTGTINWTSLNTGIATTNSNAIVYLPTSSVLVTGTIGEGIYKTPSASINWTGMNNGFNNIVTHSMICKDALLVIAATEKGVFRSIDLATSYQRINIGLTDSLNVNDLVFFGSTLIAATENNGVFISSDRNNVVSL